MRIRSIALGACICAIGLPAHAGTLVVTTTADSGAGSLRDAIAAANSGDTIQFDPALKGQTITLTTAQLLIEKNLTIDGPGPDQLAIKRSTVGGTPSFRIVQINSATVTIHGLTMSNGFLPERGSLGGAIFSHGASMTLVNSIISGSSAAYGGGIGITEGFGSPLSVIRNTIVTGNSATVAGGGIYNTASGGASNFASLDDTTISDNSAPFGAGIFNDNFGDTVNLLINDSTISDNQASTNGGGIHNRAGFVATTALVALTNCTISGNSAMLGAAIINDALADGRATVVIANTTLSNNSAQSGTGIRNQGVSNNAFLEIGNTILKTGSSGQNISNNSGSIQSHGYNLCNDGGGGFLNAVGDQINTDPILGPLQNNGGPTFTHALLNGSPAIDAGNPDFTPPPLYDQRGSGYARVYNGRIDIGSLEVQPTSTISPTPTASQTPSPVPSTKLLNISTRLRVLTGDNALIGGFIVTGSVSKRVIIRAIGPSLANFGVPDALPDPVLELHGPAGFSTITNDNWRDSQESEIMATGLAPADNLESAIVGMLLPGAYTAVMRGNNAGTGVGLVEAYDLDSAIDAKLANISTRGFVLTGNNVMIGGFILGNGNANARILIRAIGPSLTPFGVPDALADPTLELHNSDGATIAANDNWRDTQQVEIEATGIPPSDDRESAIVQALVPGAYTAIVRGKNETVGVALVEAYQLGGGSFTPTPTPTATATSTAIATPTPTPSVTPSPIPSVTPSPTPSIAKFSLLTSRATVGTGDAIMLNAFIITGPDPRRVIVRGLGPSLGVPMVLADPALDLRDSNGALLLSNDNWRSTQEAEIIATGLPPANDLEAAAVATLPAGSYTVVLRGVNNTTGIGVGDLHDLSPNTSSSLTAIGTRANVLTGDNALTTGISMQQGGDVLLRVLGPSLAKAGIGAVLMDPTLELRDGNGLLLFANDNWQDDPVQAAQIMQTGLAPTTNLESAIFANLAPGTYTAVARGKNNTIGIGYVQFYTLPHSGPVLKLTP